MSLNPRGLFLKRDTYNYSSIRGYATKIVVVIWHRI